MTKKLSKILEKKDKRNTLKSRGLGVLCHTINTQKNGIEHHRNETLEKDIEICEKRC